MSEADKQRIEDRRQARERIEGHRWAEEVLSDVGEHGSVVFTEGFWREVAKHMPERFKIVVRTARPMTDEESRRFGGDRLKFGKYFNERYDEVPLDYLEWLVERNEELRRYLTSRRIKEEKGDDEL
jgi:hypothetical protein